MTGYTHQLVEKKQSFPEFALTCARAFGALVEMRDQAIDVPCPERIEPSAYHKEQIEKDERELARLLAMDLMARRNWGREKILEEERRLLKSQKEARVRMEIMRGTLEKVRAWTPPTPDHQGIKTFMEQQLSDSIHYEDPNYADDELKKLLEKTPLQRWEEQVSSLDESVRYHRKADREEVQRTEQRNAWIKALRESLVTK